MCYIVDSVEMLTRTPSPPHPRATDLLSVWDIEFGTLQGQVEMRPVDTDSHSKHAAPEVFQV